MSDKELDEILQKLFEHGVFASPESRGTPEARKHAFNSQRDIYCNEAKQAIKEELEKNIFISGTDESEGVDKILSRLVSSIVGLKLANAKDYKEFVPTAKKALQSLLKQAELGGRYDELKNSYDLTDHKDTRLAELESQMEKEG